MQDFPKINGYNLTEKLGSGSLTCVYKAHNLEQRIVAIKVLSSRDCEDIERFKKEFLLVSSLIHPNIVRVFDFGFTDDGYPFFSMEFIEGRDFKVYFNEMDYSKFYHVFMEVLQVLEFLYIKDIIHGDIKPSNILISSSEDGNPLVKFTDFGFAEFGKRPESAYWKGTIPYLAPEIIRGEQYDHQSDLYSLGVMVYEVLTGTLPFEESDAMNMAIVHLEKKPEFPGDTKTPPFLKELTLRLLKKDPLDRYYSAREVIEDLEGAYGIKEKQTELVLGQGLIASCQMVGREEELALLKYLFEEGKCGRREIILLKSERGIGKTRLLRELKNFLQTNGATVIMNSIQDSVEASSSEFEKVSAQSYPVVLIFDDSQKTDFEILNSLLSGINQMEMDKMIVCFTLDNNQTLSEEDKKTQHVERMLESNLNGALTKMVLKPLDQKETSEVINRMFQWKVDKERSDQIIYQKTAGNPLLILSLMNSLLEQGYIRKKEPDWELDLLDLEVINGPETYVKEIKKRLSRLSSESLSLIHIASVLGQEFESDVLSEVSGFSEDYTANQLTLMSLENLLQRSSSSDKIYAFVNGLVRDLIYNDVNKVRRKVLHNKVGEVLEKKYSSTLDSVSNTLARHFVKAENEELAFKYSLLAGQKSGNENDHVEAIKHYENALRFYERRVNEPLTPKEEILTRLGKQYAITGNYDRALNYYSEAIKVCREENQTSDRIAKLYQEVGVLHLRKGDYENAIKILDEGILICSGVECPKVLAELDITLGWVYQKKSDSFKAISCFEQSVGLLGKESSRESGLALNGLGVVYWGLGELNRALNCYQKSLKVFDDLKDENGSATVNINLGLFHRSKGEPKEALRYFEKALQWEQRSGDIVDLSFLYNNLALTWESLYGWDKSLEYHQRSYEIKEKMGDQDGVAIALTNMGIVHLKRGVISKSLENHFKAFRIFEYLRDKLGMAHSYLNLGEIYLFKEEWSKSRDYLERGSRLFKELDDKSGFADSLKLLGSLNLESGDFAIAFSQLKESLKLYDILGNPQKMLEVTLSLAKLRLCQASMTESEIHLNYAEKLLNTVDDQALKGKFKKVRAMFLKQRGKLEESLSELLEADNIFKMLNMRYERSGICLEIGKIKSGQKRFKESKVYLKEALVIFKEAEIQSKVSECETLLRDLSALTLTDYQRTQVLYQVSELLTRITDADELLVKVLDLAIEHLSAERAAVILYDPKDDSFELKAARGIEQETEADALNISQRVIKNVLRKEEPLIIEDARSDPETSSYKSVITHNILSILCVPLVASSGTLGTIYVDHRSLSGIFSKEDLDLLKAFANLVAVALEKAKLYGKLHEEIFQLKKDLRKTYSYPNIIGGSKRMQEVFQMVEKVASTKTSILLLGESGTGKELIANLIHHTGVRKDKPFVKVNCAALPESILESELFGVEEKVATGVAMRDGKFKQADGGTIFFDEIGDMSISTQAKVLRVLQEREFERVGGSKTIKVDIRVVSATNKNIDECIKKGAFRKDLFYRLNPVTIKIPPLRERKEDLPYLIEYFLEKFSLENKKPKPAIPVKVINLLTDYSWPGNVRELANLMERAVLFSEDGSFPKEFLPTKAQIQRDVKLLSPKDGLTKVMDNVEKEMLVQALEKNGWNQVKAALQLGISEATLRRKMAKHKLKRPERDSRQK